MTVSLFAVGTNQATRGNDLASTVSTAIELLREEYRLSVKDVSPFYATPAWPPGNGPDFVNAAATLESDLHPMEILQIFHDVEARMGRERPVRWAPRTIDLDLLAVGEAILPDRETVQQWIDMSGETAAQRTPQEMILPHPRMHERAFVVVPLHDVAPKWNHPILKQSVAEILALLPPEDVDQVRRLV